MRSKRRGSIFIYVVMMMTALTAIILAASSLSVNAVTSQKRREEAVLARHGFQGVVNKIVADAENGTLNIGLTHNIIIGDQNWTVSIANNSTPAKTYKITGSGTVKGKTYRFERIVGTRAPSYPHYWAIFCNSSLNSNFAVNTGSGGLNGDVYAFGDIDFQASSLANGDMQLTGIIRNNSTTKMTGAKLHKGRSIAFPDPSPHTASYKSAAGLNLYLGNTLFSAIVFGVAVGDYPVMFVDGNLTLNGLLTGVGTVFVTGSITINGNVTYASTLSRAAFICLGDVNVNSNVSTINGYYYSKGAFKTAGTSLLTLARGGVAASQFDLTRPVTIVNDPYLFQNVTEGVKMHMPGQWP